MAYLRKIRHRVENELHGRVTLLLARQKSHLAAVRNRDEFGLDKTRPAIIFQPLVERPIETRRIGLVLCLNANQPDEIFEIGCLSGQLWWLSYA